MGYEQIRVSVDEGVARITLNRPERLNALTTRMSDELLDALASLRDDRSVRCLVLTGEGRGFCAGQDLTEFRDEYEAGRERDIEAHLRHTYNRLIPAVADLPLPVVAAVNGVAAGAGLSLALACDLRVASDDARFTLAFVKIGLIPDSGATFMLSRVVGYPKAVELSITGDLIDAGAALDIGLVSRVVAGPALEEEMMALATRLAALPTGAIAETKRLFREGLSGSLPEALEREAVAQGRLGRTEDHREGVRAFLEKREPRFTGR